MKSSNSPQPNSSSDKKDPTHTTVTRQSNAQWNRNTQPTSVDNVNGYPGPQNQHPQNGWQNGRDNHRYSDRGRKGSNRQQNRFTGSSASGANDTPLGVSRRSSVDDPVVVNGVAPTFEPGNRADDASQANPKAEISEAKGKPPKEKRKPKVVGSTVRGMQSLTSRVITDHFFDYLFFRTVLLLTLGKGSRLNPTLSKQRKILKSFIMTARRSGRKW